MPNACNYMATYSPTNTRFTVMYCCCNLTTQECSKVPVRDVTYCCLQQVGKDHISMTPCFHILVLIVMHQVGKEGCQEGLLVGSFTRGRTVVNSINGVLHMKLEPWEDGALFASQFHHNLNFPWPRELCNQDNETELSPTSSMHSCSWHVQYVPHVFSKSFAQSQCQLETRTRKFGLHCLWAQTDNRHGLGRLLNRALAEEIQCNENILR